jgi:NAD(P)-dependent dehydrogenase (short-subunit alcohol dehydrogenase family)
VRREGWCASAFGCFDPGNLARCGAFSNTGALLNPDGGTDSVTLTGQVAVVTGGGRGLGRAFAQALAAAGASVAVVARSANELADTVALIEQSGGLAGLFPADVTHEAAVRAAFAQIERTMGPVDLLVSNAGTIGRIGPFATTDIADWWRAMDVNVRGPLQCLSVVLPGMIARGRGRIIHVATSAVPIAYLSSYMTSKTALIRATECIAAEVKPYGISMFSISPGTVRTAMSEHSLNSAEGTTWIPWYRRVFDEGLDLPPERPARLVVTLASGKADALTGLYVTPYDDLDALLQRTAEIEREKLCTLRIRPLGVSAEAAARTAIQDRAQRPQS